MVKDGVVVIDVGITRVTSDSTKSGFKLLGDVKYDEVAAKSSFITPVPGGVGPMTIASLLVNTLKASKKEVYKYWLTVFYSKYPSCISILGGFLSINK
jgi:methylenetetrahydrofolate dehydrogenase (NADP+)/methenyltetrahydrofolate cyclohydrolase